MNTTTLGHALLEALNNHDLSSWQSLLADDFRAEYPGERLLDASQAAAYNQAFVDAFADLRFAIHDTWEVGTLTIVHWTATGTQTAELRTRQRLLPNTRKTGQLSGVILVDSQNGRITRERSYWDRLDLLTQLGLS